VEIAASGLPAPLVHFISATQAQDSGPASGPGGAASGADASGERPSGAQTASGRFGPLLIEKAEIQASRTKSDEAILQATFVAARVTGGS
jgi:hypothetical protein